mgnify:FL=1
MCYLFLVFFEGFFVSIPFFTSGSRVSAADHKPLVLRSIENLTPRATYQMEGFDTIGVRFVLTQEIRAHQISADCPGDVHVVQVHVDMGIEYSVVYRPSEYCEVVRFFIGDIEIHKVVWDRWGSILEALLDIPSSLLTAQVADIDVKIEKGGY